MPKWVIKRWWSAGRACDRGLIINKIVALPGGARRLLLPWPGIAAIFDCAGLPPSIEQAICANATLSQLDDALSRTCSMRAANIGDGARKDLQATAEEVTGATRAGARTSCLHLSPADRRNAPIRCSPARPAESLRTSSRAADGTRQATGLTESRTGPSRSRVHIRPAPQLPQARSSLLVKRRRIASTRPGPRRCRRHPGCRRVEAGPGQDEAVGVGDGQRVGRGAAVEKAHLTMKSPRPKVPMCQDVLLGDQHLHPQRAAADENQVAARHAR